MEHKDEAGDHDAGADEFEETQCADETWVSVVWITVAVEVVRWWRVRTVFVNHGLAGGWGGFKNVIILFAREFVSR